MSPASGTLSAAQLAVRRPVWAALSELYLDTDTRPDLPRLALTLAVSGLGGPELEAIWHDEITPPLHGNLLVVAGEWAGFDLDWLEAQILSRRARLDRRWLPLKKVIRRLQNGMDPYFQTALTLRGELLTRPEAEWAPRVDAWTWLARAYFWPDSPLLGPAPDTPGLAALFVALEPHLRPLLTSKEPAPHHRLHVLSLIGDPL